MSLARTNPFWRVPAKQFLRAKTEPLGPRGRVASFPMASFFTPNFPDTIVHTKWHQRKAFLRAHQLQASNDALYAVVQDSILARRSELHAALLESVEAANGPADLHIPLWSYHTAHYLRSLGSLDFETADASETLLRDKGYQWFVGLTAQNPEPDDWDALWGWGPPQTVHDVVRQTDFLSRIALLFGTEHYRVSYQIQARKILTEPTDIVVERMALVLHYHPNGLYDHVAATLQATAAKYENRMVVNAEWERPLVWQGRPEPEEAQELAIPMVEDPPPCHCAYPYDEAM